MNSQTFTAEIRIQKLSTGELISLCATGILASILIISAIFLNWGKSFLFWQIPNVIFATVVVGATFVLVRRGQPLTFKQAFKIIVVGLAVTNAVVVVQFGWLFDWYFTTDVFTSLIFRHYAMYVLPVVIMFLLGAAQTSRQLLVSCLLLVGILLVLLAPVSWPGGQSMVSVFYCLNILLGFPLTVLGRQYS